MLLSMIIPKETSLFRYSRKTKAIIPLQKFLLFLFHYSSSAPDIEAVLILIYFMNSFLFYLITSSSITMLC